MQTPMIVEATAGTVAEELRRRSIDADEPVRHMFEPELFPGRRASRKFVVAASLSDPDIDDLIERAREEVAPRLG